MTLRNSIISIENLRIHAFHGVMEQERNVGTDFLLSLHIHYNIGKAMETDEVSDTLNYAEACEVVTQEMKTPSKLLEHVASRICKALFQRFPQATAISLKLTKQNPPMGADCDGASIEVYVTND